MDLPQLGAAWFRLRIFVRRSLSSITTSMRRNPRPHIFGSIADELRAELDEHRPSALPPPGAQRFRLDPQHARNLYVFE
ncbi:MAG TPA: hypothetical protein VKS22_00140 [Candidatus Binataceae bacterium]|nr:hypothetical protein [Candidatus Binataceae bacterium]